MIGRPFNAGGLPSKIEKLAAALHWRCFWCDFLMAGDTDEAGEVLASEWPGYASFSKPVKKQLRRHILVSFDHLVPKAEGGTKAATNGLASCTWCNSFRGREPIDEFRERITGLVQRGEHPRQVFRLTGEWPKSPRKSAIGNGGTWRSEAAT